MRIEFNNKINYTAKASQLEKGLNVFERGIFENYVGKPPFFLTERDIMNIGTIPVKREPDTTKVTLETGKEFTLSCYTDYQHHCPDYILGSTPDGVTSCPVDIQA